MLSGFFPGSFGVLFCRCGGRLPIHTLNYWTVQSVVSGFKLGVCLSAILLIVDMRQYCVCSLKSGVTRCTILTVLYLDRKYQCVFHAVLWLHMGILMRHLSAEPLSTALFLFLSQCPSGPILLTPYSIVWDWRVSGAGPMLFYCPRIIYPYIYIYYKLLLLNPFSSFYI